MDLNITKEFKKCKILWSIKKSFISHLDTRPMEMYWKVLETEVKMSINNI